MDYNEVRPHSSLNKLTPASLPNRRRPHGGLWDTIQLAIQPKQLEPNQTDSHSLGLKLGAGRGEALFSRQNTTNFQFTKLHLIGL